MVVVQGVEGTGGRRSWWVGVVGVSSCGVGVGGGLSVSLTMRSLGEAVLGRLLWWGIRRPKTVRNASCHGEAGVGVEMEAVNVGEPLLSMLRGLGKGLSSRGRQQSNTLGGHLLGHSVSRGVSTGSIR